MTKKSTYTWDRLTWVQTPEKGNCQIVNCVAATYLAIGIKVCNDGIQTYEKLLFACGQRSYKVKEKTRVQGVSVGKVIVFFTASVLKSGCGACLCSQHQESGDGRILLWLTARQLLWRAPAKDFE